MRNIWDKAGHGPSSFLPADIHVVISFSYSLHLLTRTTDTKTGTALRFTPKLPNKCILKVRMWNNTATITWKHL